MLIYQGGEGGVLLSVGEPHGCTGRGQTGDAAGGVCGMGAALQLALDDGLVKQDCIGAN